jgi:hypothetical protein
MTVLEVKNWQGQDWACRKARDDRWGAGRPDGKVAIVTGAAAADTGIIQLGTLADSTPEDWHHVMGIEGWSAAGRPGVGRTDFQPQPN